MLGWMVVPILMHAQLKNVGIDRVRHRAVALLGLIGLLTMLPVLTAAATPAQPVPHERDATWVEIPLPAGPDGPEITLVGLLALPAAEGPFPVVILLHGCGGLTAVAMHRAQEWASLLSEQGYATLVLDSFTGRGLTGVCNGGGLSGRARAVDVYAAALYLANLPDIQPARIAVMGFSHGGWTALHAAAQREPTLLSLREQLAAANGALAAVIGLYPACRDTARQDFVAPQLILIGDLDDWTPASNCTALAAKARPGGPELQLTVYPGAHHDFDVNLPPRKRFGHTLAYNAAADTDARQQVAAFLMRYLGHPE